ncbi:hypothetical protein O6H91_06G007100 [Diphasiastrum complanatum]|uniref:Uncharacterized protein n=2 Tax=Diphasiastrum complanatum TaxID=34168 RepID=A0ACC2DAK0_DIPCM|nr:hypothetical protein O6H91_06G007100 [Diphasiastrum complanatum]KAJ7551254.1 hypothetical protein O6H91_06G007100 [Diphasiastrum complanatum]
MLSQPVNLASFLSKDASKRKRLNRTAKLKQCKLDARREQWLSQVKHSSCNYQHAQAETEYDKEAQEGKSEDGVLRQNVNTTSLQAQASSAFKNLRVSTEEYSPAESSTAVGSDDESLTDFSKTDEPSLVEETLSERNSKQGKGSEWSGSDICTCISGSSENGSDQDKEYDSNVEDDWEAAADALTFPILPPSQDFIEEDKNTNLEIEVLPLQGQIVQQYAMISSNYKLQTDILKPEYKVNSIGSRTRAIDSRAWRPNDIIPRLWKQHASHLESCVSVWAAVHSQSRWEPPIAPLECPICTEELDSTDYSFKPCSCGFRLCLFCYHKIAVEDGRCPGCRKAYSADASGNLSHSVAHC